MAPPRQRVIFHVDMDMFFAAIAVLDDPSLAGKAVLTGGSRGRGVVTTASYEARKYGCRSAMPMQQALRLCPHALCVKVPGARIREKSREMFAVLDEFSPVVQPVSVDEAYLDMTGTERLLGPPQAVAARLKDAIKGRTGLTASVGVSFNKFLAKLGSDLNKPDGLAVITPDNLDQTLMPLPIDRLWGAGPATVRQFQKHRLKTIGDLRRLSAQDVASRFGDHGEHFYRLCRGIDDRPVVPDREAKSIGHEQTFFTNLTDPDDVRATLLDQAEQVGFRLRKQGKHARGVTVKVRFGDFQTITRSTTFDTPTDVTEAIYQAGRTLFDRWAAGSFSPVRLVGISASPLTDSPGQQPLFPDPRQEKQRRVDAALDRITHRFGKRTVHRGNPTR